MSNEPRYVGSPGSLKPYAVEVSPGVWKPAFVCCCNQCCSIALQDETGAETATICCVSDKSVLNFTKPTIVDDGADAVTAAMIVAYNATDTSEMPITVFCNPVGTLWEVWSDTFVVSGTTYKVLIQVSACWTYVVTLFYWTGTAWSYVSGYVEGNNYVTHTCCGFSGGTDTALHGGYHLIGSSSGVLSNNKCCYNGTDCTRTAADACPDGAPECEEI